MAYGSKQVILLSLGAVLLGTVLVYGLKGGLPLESQAEGPITVERVFEDLGLKLSMSVEKSVYAYGEPINVTLTLKNIVNETITIVRGDKGHRLGFSVFNMSDIFNASKPEPEVIWSEPQSMGVIPVLDYIVLNAGDSITSTLQWQQQQQLLGGQVVHAPPGTYYIFGQTKHILWVERGASSEEHVGFLYLYEPIEIIILSQ